MPASLSTMVSTAVGRLPNVAPGLRFERVKLTVSVGSTIRSSTIGMGMVLLVSPLAKLIMIGLLLKLKTC